MKIAYDYMQKYLHESAIEQLADDYKQKGYEVRKAVPVGDFKADLVVVLGDEKIVIEVQAGIMPPNRKQILKDVSKYAKKEGYKFFVAFASMPADKQIKIENIEIVILEYLNANFPEQLKEIPAIKNIISVSAVGIDSVDVKGNAFTIHGEGSMTLDIIDEEDNKPYTQTFPFTFGMVLESNLEKSYSIVKVNELDIDLFDY